MRIHLFCNGIEAKAGREGYLESESLGVSPDDETRETVVEIPVVPHLDAQILQVTQGRTVREEDELIDGERVLRLDMSSWHCGTTHCRAGFAVLLAGEEGKALEKEYGSQIAGGLIYLASTGIIPDFFERTRAAMEDIRRCAALDPLPEGV